MSVITLCGSTKFKNQFYQANTFLTLQGHIVISVAFFEQSEGFELTEQQAELLGELHFRKIDLSDEIFVIDVGGYIGTSTRREIEYAQEKGRSFGITLVGRFPKLHSDRKPIAEELASSRCQFFIANIVWYNTQACIIINKPYKLKSKSTERIIRCKRTQT
ncbi:hypothetical protein [Paenibacillus albus]|uniref:hypothetical protein n=1 Tax=Paenibacillus albus TaxID=2495582 RepID=UPI002ACB094B|nr:hypothetical protein [Paenibacillus albus]